MDKTQLKAREAQIIDLVKDFCTQKLDEEYTDLSVRLVQKLGRKRSPPFASGQSQIWAAAVIHALGTINFLFDKSSKPYASIDDINDFFGTKKSTVGNKSKEIRDLLKLSRWDQEFSTKRMNDSNPFANLVSVNGLLISVNSLPEQYQALVRQARAEGRDISFRTL